jgi:hypothetical protein
MRRSPKRSTLAGLAAILCLASPRAGAVDEIQVYNAEIAPVGHFSVAQHLNYVFQGTTTPDFPGGIASNRTLNGTPEFAYGVTDWLELGLYAPFTLTPEGTFYSQGAKIRALAVSPNAAERKFFYGMNVELAYITPAFSQSAVGLEFRPILGVRDLGWEAIINPIVDIGFGPNGSVQFAPAARVARQVRDEVWIGAEYYSNFGPFNTFDNALQQQPHTLFAVIDFVAFGVDINFGIGFGLTDPADQLVAKLIVSRSF